MAARENRPWGQAKRFEFIEWRIFWTGRLNRINLEEQFGISTPQASIDLRNYQEAAPGNIAYDSTLKTFTRTEGFEPQFLRVSGERYLLQLRAMQMGAIEKEDTWFADIPNVDVVPQFTRKINDEILRTIASSVEKRASLIVNYKSLTNTRQRMIGPHSLVHDGFRWHVRAWCFERHEFKDFSLTRIISAVEVPRADFDPAKDIEWHRKTTLILQAHPDLSAEQRNTIELDFGMVDGSVSIDMRIALVYYFIRRNNLDMRSFPPLRQQVVLSNADQVEKEVLEARDESKRLVG